MTPEFSPGMLVLHTIFGAGTIVSNDGEVIEVNFKLRGLKKLAAKTAAEYFAGSPLQNGDPPGL